MDGGTLLVLFLAVGLGGPLLLALWGLIRRTPRVSTVAAPWDWRLTIRSALLYALAFNIIFFIQELFLVVPKALTPGLRPTLYHNNHGWEGDHPLAGLFQGTGALAILVTGLAFAWLARRSTGGSANLRLFVFWMAFHGLFQSLPQAVIGAAVPQNDVGMAYDYLGMGPAAKTAAALLALAGIVAAGLWLPRPLLAITGRASRIADARARKAFVFRLATLPALLAVPLIIAFRVPREWIEVAAPPVIVTILGIAWIQAGAWRAAGVRPGKGSLGGSVWVPLALLLALLLIFQLVLRPGIPFY